MLTWITSKLTGYAVAIAAALALLFGIYRKGGTDAAHKQTETRLESLKQAREVEDEVDRLGPADLDGRYRQWLRDN
ncbi:MAG: hypothetical protein IBJ07_08910 [Rhizobiaceae bacterium]|nr:hypothetical protein [Rhizobiaceae bacterium]